MLAGVGQMASPLQSLWVYAHALRDIQTKHGMKAIEPLEIFVRYGNQLFQERNELLQCGHSANRYMDLFETAWKNLLGPQVVNPPVVEDKMPGETPPIEVFSFPSVSEKGPKSNLNQELSHSRDETETPFPDEKTTQNQAVGIRRIEQPEVCDTALIQVVKNAEKRARDSTEFLTGGVPGFAVKKARIETPVVPTIETIAIDDRQNAPIEQREEDLKDKVRDQNSDPIMGGVLPEPIPADASEHQQSPTMQILVIVGDSPPHETKVPSGCPVWKVAKAEENLQTMKQPIAIADMMGCSITLTNELQPHQMIRLQEGGLNPGKCPREGRSVKPSHTNASRQQILWKQEGWVAWDEMEFYASRINKVQPHCFFPGIAIADDPSGPIQLTQHIWNMMQWGSKHQLQRVVSYFLLCDHWTPICVEIGSTTVVYTTPMQVTWVRECCLSGWGHTSLQFSDHPIASVFPADCGFQTIGWMNSMIAFETTLIPIQIAVACEWRHSFSLHLEQTNQADILITKPLVVGGMQTTQDELQRFVESHGVASHRSQSCAKELIDALGLSSVQGILRSPKPWADLKARASLHRPPIRVVMASELSESIKNRKATGVVGSKTSKAKKSGAYQDPIALQASQLEIPQAVFKQSDDVELGQLQPHQIGTGCQGVLLVNIQDALPYFSLGSAVTTEGAALLIIDHSDNRIPSTREIIRVPAHCKATSEPVILTVAMLQLGQKTVMRNTPSQWVAIKEVENKVIRVLLFRDQYSGQWQEIADKPVKSILAMEPFASLAPHNILDVWDRQFTSLRMSKTPPSDAEVFLVNMRVTADVIQALMGASGNEGLFVEPRSHNGRQPDSEYQIVWLPRKTYAEAVIARQTTTTTTVLARSGDKYGLRVPMADAEKVHTMHRPDLMFMQGGELKRYRVGPLPYGSTKQSIVNAFQKWGWQARPISPCGQSQDQTGVMWHVQASEPPAFWIFQMQHGDVLVTPENPGSTSSVNHPGGIIASNKTIQCLREAKGPIQAKSDQEDPWRHYDPWQSSAKEVSVGQVLSLQTQLEASIDKKIADMGQSHMEDDNTERIANLEQQMHQMNASMQSFQQQQVQHTQTLYGQVQAMEKRLNDQNQSINNMLDSKLEDQMQKIEMLLTKRSRTE